MIIFAFTRSQYIMLCLSLLLSLFAACFNFNYSPEYLDSLRRQQTRSG